MTNIPRITIEKRIFKINNNEDFILEYPSNYEEIVNKKLKNIENEYEESQIRIKEIQENNSPNIHLLFKI